MKNGLIGKLNEETPFVIYCNEKDKKSETGFIFLCCEGCKHNPITSDIREAVEGMKKSKDFFERENKYHPIAESLLQAYNQAIEDVTELLNTYDKNL